MFFYIWTAGWPIQHRTLLLRSHAVVISAVCGFALSCWNTQGLPWNTCRLEGSICWSKIFYIPFSIHSAFQSMQAAHTVCTYAPPYHQRFWLLNWTDTDFRIFRPLRDGIRVDPRIFFFLGGGLVGYCMIEIAQLALSYCLNKLLKVSFLKHKRRNDHESAAWGRGTICRTVKRSNDSKHQTRTELALVMKLVTRPDDFLWMAVRIWDCLCCHKTPTGCDVII